MPYRAIHVVRVSGWHSTRSDRVTTRLPDSPSTALTSLEDPWEVMATIRRVEGDLRKEIGELKALVERAMGEAPAANVKPGAKKSGR